MQSFRIHSLSCVNAVIENNFWSFDFRKNSRYFLISMKQVRNDESLWSKQNVTNWRDLLAFHLLLEIWKQCFEHLKNVYRDMLHCHPFRRCSSTGSSSLRRPSIPNSSARACVSYLVRCFQFHQAWDSRWIIMQIYAWLWEGVSNNHRTSGLWSRFRNVLKEGRKKDRPQGSSACRWTSW